MCTSPNTVAHLGKCHGDPQNNHYISQVLAEPGKIFFCDTQQGHLAITMSW
jgi:hypothetical protein